MTILCHASINFDFNDIASLGLKQQEALDDTSDWFVMYVLLDGEEALVSRMGLNL